MRHPQRGRRHLEVLNVGTSAMRTRGMSFLCLVPFPRLAWRGYTLSPSAAVCRPSEHVALSLRSRIRNCWKVKATTEAEAATALATALAEARTDANAEAELSLQRSQRQRPSPPRLRRSARRGKGEAAALPLQPQRQKQRQGQAAATLAAALTEARAEAKPSMKNDTRRKEQQTAFNKMR